MKILIVGDSFCQNYGPGTWPALLGELCSAEVMCIGRGGISNYKILENFRKYWNNGFNFIIPVMTSSDRIPFVDHEIPLNNFKPGHPSWSEKDPTLPTGYLEAVKGWIMFYHNIEYLTWVTASVMREIEDTTLPNQTIIWLNALLDEKTFDNNARHGIKIKGDLNSFSSRELTDHGTTVHEYIRNHGEIRLNHFTDANHIALSEFLASVIAKCQTSKLRLNELDLKHVNWERDPANLRIYKK
jgi:hypothetical protein